MVTVVSEASPNGLWLKYPPTVFDKACFTTALKTLRGQPHKLCGPDQPRMPFEPMPELVEPCLAVSAKRVPDAAD